MYNVQLFYFLEEFLYILNIIFFRKNIAFKR